MVLTPINKNKIVQKKVADIDATPYNIAGERDFNQGLEWNRKNAPQGASQRGRLWIGQEQKWEGIDPKSVWRKRWNKIDEVTNRRELV